MKVSYAVLKKPNKDESSAAKDSKNNEYINPH